MTKYFNRILVAISVILLTAQPSFSQDITLSWDPSPTPDVAGYYLYYKHNSSALPFDGVDADQGASPLDVGNSLSTTLTNLSDSGVYYFAVTAYDSSREESTFSNIVSNNWMPELLTPVNNANNEPVPVTFQWTTEPSGAALNYTLYYGTDSDLVAAAGTVGQSNLISSRPETPISLVFLLALLILLAFKQPANRKLKLAAGFIATCIALSACGGGGGGGESASGRSSTETTSTDPDNSSSAQAVFTVAKSSSDYHQAFDLESGTTYFWKVVAVDVNDPSQVHSSPVASFTTESI